MTGRVFGEQVPRTLAFDAGGDSIRGTLERFELQNMSLFRPNIKTTSDTAIRTDGFRMPSSGFAHLISTFGQFRSVV